MPSFQWLSNTPLCIYTTSSSQRPSMIQFPATSLPSPASLPFFTLSTSAELTCVVPCAHQAPLLLATLHWLFPIWNALFHMCACSFSSFKSTPISPPHQGFPGFNMLTCSHPNIPDPSSLDPFLFFLQCFSPSNTLISLLHLQWKLSVMRAESFVCFFH